MAFLKQFNVELPFEFQRLKDIREFVWFCERPDVEFLDADLESLRCTLFTSADSFYDLLGHNTFPKTDSPRDENELPREWQYEQPQRYFKVLQELLDSKRLLLDSFALFISTGRRKLGIEFLSDVNSDLGN